MDLMRRFGWLCATLFCVAGGAMAQAQQQAAEPAVKAAFLYKFAGYVEWPPATFANPETPFTIAIVGSDEVAAELEKLVPGRQINGRRVVVRKLREGESPRGAHLLFVGKADGTPRAMLRAAQQNGVLAVTESDKGLELGSAINFVVAEERVGFEVNLDVAERSGLRISSRMLQVARRVVPRS